MIKVTLILKVRSSFPCVHPLIFFSTSASNSGILMRKRISDWAKGSLSPKGNQIQACWGISGSGKSQISLALLATDAQVTILPRLLEGGSAQIQLTGFGHSSQ